MLRAIFFQDVFIPKQRALKAKVNMRTKYLRAAIHALIDSGATDNFISPEIAHCFRLPMHELKKHRLIQNVDGSRNSIGSVTHTITLQVHSDTETHSQRSFVIDLGGDDMLLGYPFLAAVNPQIDWTEGIYPGEVTLSTHNSGAWNPERQQRTIEENNEQSFLGSKEEGITYSDFIPKNERNTTQYPYIYARKVTTATQLAIDGRNDYLFKFTMPKPDPLKKVPKEYFKFRKVFSEEEAQRFPKSKPYDHAIDLLPDAPATLDCKIYPLAPGEQTALNDFIKEHLKKGYIRPSNSPYASPFFFIKKKDGKLHPVQDYRQLNKWTVRNKYPLPLIKELIAQLKNKVWFTKFDVRWGYNNVRIKDGDQWKAAFKTNRGLFELTVMFFGLTNSPATFQTMMDDIFRHEIATGAVIIYMDDILIATSGTLDMHRSHVSHVLAKLMANDLYLKPEKCEFHKKEVEYLGVIVGNGQVKMDPVKVKGLTDWPQPTKVKELRSFLGFGNYYKDFIPNYSLIARPLHDLTQKNQQWNWGIRQQTSFNTLKKLFTSYPVLRNADYDKRFILTTDASAYAIGATLQQDFKDGRHPVAYFSKSLLPAERNYNIYDRELLSIIYAIKAFRYMLLGAKHKILIQSDHNNLKYFKSARKITPRQARWMEFLEDYDFELEHLPGYTNTVADLLSRRSDLEEGVKINDSAVVLPEHLFARRIFTETEKIYLEDDLDK